ALTIAKSITLGGTYMEVGDVVEYSYVITNSGNVELAGPFTVVDDKIADIDPVDGPLAVGASVTVTATYTITAEDIEAGEVTNTAYATTEYGDDTVTSNEDSATAVLQLDEPSITITNDADRATFGNVGEVITYSYVVTNNGDVTLTNVIVIDPLTGTETNIGTLEPGESKTVTGTYTVTSEDFVRGFIENTATATGTAPDNSTVTASDDERVEAVVSEIVANDDRITGIKGADGGIAVVNVFKNDSLNGRPISPEEVILTLLEGNEYLVLNPDGSVDVKPGTPEGEYELVYQICEVGNPGNCSTATVIISVNPPTIDAVDDDFGTHKVSYRGQLGNILDNDLLNGEKMDANLVNYQIIDAAGLQGLIIYQNGDFEVIGGLNAPGTYILQYRVCEILNPTNCDTAFVIVIIEADEVDLSVTKTSFGVELFEGDEFEYEIVVSNLGDTDATDVSVVDDLPAGITYLGSLITQNPDNLTVNTSAFNSQVVWTIPSFPAGSSITIRLRVRANDVVGGVEQVISNLVTVTSTEADSNTDNNSDRDANVVKPFFIPNVITPNGDGINDIWRIKGINKFVKRRIVIFNRWGDHLYEKDNYQNDWSANGIVSGTYYYIVWTEDRSGRTHEYKGWIQVIREEKQ
ncbi:conserved repeat domain-containing protein/gliding motility-associated C-terminal domain-containing protein, partial [Algoriphagus hitonicola]